MRDEEHQPDNSKATPDHVTGKDVGVIVCRIASVWITFQAIAAFGLFVPIAIESFQYSEEKWVLRCLITFAAFFVYLILGLFFWVFADRIATKMLPNAVDRVLLMSVGPQDAMRIALVTVGFLLGIPAVTSLVLKSANLLIELYAAVTSRASSQFAVLDPAHDYGLIRPLFTLALSLVCVFGAGSITRFLFRVKSVKLNTDENAE